MLIGCCHCDQPSESIPSESQPSVPSESQSVSQSVSESQSVSQSSQSVSESIPPGPCGACDLTNGYRPSAVQISWELTEYEPDRYFDVWSLTGGCYSDYTGPFVVYSDNGQELNTALLSSGGSVPPDAPQCYYGAVESALLSSDCSATIESPNCRAFLWFLKRGTGDYEIYALISWFNDMTGTTEGLSDGGIWYLLSGIPSLNCFSTYTLNFWQMRGKHMGSPGSFNFSPGPGYNYEYSDDSPTLTNSFPATITITPL